MGPDINDLTMRDFFAAMALLGVTNLSWDTFTDQVEKIMAGESPAGRDKSFPQSVAHVSYAIADSMLDEREKQK